MQWRQVGRWYPGATGSDRNIIYKKNCNLVGDPWIFVLRGSGIEGVGKYQNYGEECQLGVGRYQISQNTGSAVLYYPTLEKIRNPGAPAGGGDDDDDGFILSLEENTIA